jgi:hypothetical protein
MTINHEQQNAEASYEEFETFLNTRLNIELSPNGLHAQLSSHYYNQARQGILRVLHDGERLGSLGYSSGGMRHHMLYRADNGNVFVVHNAYGNLSDAFYFTPSLLREYFEDSENEMPEYELSDDVKAILNRIDREAFHYED